MDVFEKCGDFTLARDAIAAGIYPYFTVLDGHEGTSALHAGRQVVMCGSNNYLGLTHDARVVEASRNALESYGTSCTGSRFLNGNLALHEELEQELADFFGKPAALVFTTGYQANVGTISALLSSEDVVIVDQRAHASVIDACRLAGVQVRRFKHNDAGDLERRLSDCRSGAATLVVVDGVYSMEGDVCSLPAISEACRGHGSRLMVDDAHGAGVLADGRGTCASFGLTDDVDLISITFSKAFASIGGAVMGSEDVIHYLRHHARSLIFSASMAPASAAAALAALRVVRDEPWRCGRALERAATARAGLIRRGFDVGASETPIVPIRMGDTLETVHLWKRLLELGVYTNPIVPPAASPRLRTSYMATHTAADIDRVLAAFETAREDDRSAVPEVAS